MFDTGNSPLRAAPPSGAIPSPNPGDPVAPGVDALRAAYGHLDGVDLVRVMV